MSFLSFISYVTQQRYHTKHNIILAIRHQDLRVAQTAADRAMEEISKALAGATERRFEVGEVKKTVAENEEKTKARKIEIEQELAEIQVFMCTYTLTRLIVFYTVEYVEIDAELTEIQFYTCFYIYIYTSKYMFVYVYA